MGEFRLQAGSIPVEGGWKAAAFQDGEIIAVSDDVFASLEECQAFGTRYLNEMIEKLKGKGFNAYRPHEN